MSEYRKYSTYAIGTYPIPAWVTKESLLGGPPPVLDLRSLDPTNTTSSLSLHSWCENGKANEWLSKFVASGRPLS